MKKQSAIKLLAVILIIAATLILSISPITGGMRLGLDLQGGAQVTLQALPEDGETVTADDMEQLVSVLDNRVNELGVSEPVIQVEGEDRIIVELAGVDDPEQAIELIGRTAQLEFVSPTGEVLLSGADLANAYAQIEENQPRVILEFNDAGAEKFFNATAMYVGQEIAIVLDGETISSPVVNTAISGGVAYISGGFANFDEAADLAALLRGGALPVDLEVLSKSTVGPTLGADSLSRSLSASAIGFTILLLYLIAYYRLPGGWAVISLVVYGLLLLWMLNLIHATLTLTSIAGFILSIGVAVDANIIIYERIREELYHGKSLKASIESGFKRALLTIVDSNVTTLIAAVVLYFFGSGTIKGFALTLSIGIVASMLTAVVFTHYVLRWSSDIDFLSSKKLYGLSKHFGYREFHFDFLRLKKVWYIAAMVVIVPGLVVLCVSGMNLGIDFTGGSIIKVQYEDQVELAAVRDAVTDIVKQTPAVNEGDDNSFIIRTEDLTQEESSAVTDALATLGTLIPSATSQEMIGPAIGAELLANARWALLIAGVLMLLYITVRFKFSYAVTAILALVHDVLVIVSVFAIFRLEVESAFIAAILTIVGYSINNTIVIFDRMRENMSFQKGKFSRAELINTSINQTLTRTINTVLAVLLLLVSLLLFGGETTRNFILALTIGMFAGFFSSVFLVGNMLADISSHVSVKWGGDKKAPRPVQKKAVPKTTER